MRGTACLGIKQSDVSSLRQVKSESILKAKGFLKSGIFRTRFSHISGRFYEIQKSFSILYIPHLGPPGGSAQGQPGSLIPSCREQSEKLPHVNLEKREKVLTRYHGLSSIINCILCKGTQKKTITSKIKVYIYRSFLSLQ